ncbi:hypothetical protein [Thermosulfurimonas sp. F29]|uniref:hypothetical protein n=1 Tax=Thermosulfurimonas sp. F29 TaxID=2867247 RepID=UPI001C82E306|nr:hypothetical protein [Thermosulfurimonas sp. F29]MBX6423803.1 hypothetical protein [Thermosulfurimonas sp. F29]
MRQMNAIEAVERNEAMGEFWMVLDEVLPDWAKDAKLGEHEDLWREMVRREWMLFTKLCRACQTALLAWAKRKRRKEPSKSEQKLHQFLRGRDPLDPDFLLECDTVMLVRYIPSGVKVENREDMREDEEEQKKKDNDERWRLIIQVREEVPLEEKRKIYTTHGVVTKTTRSVLHTFHVCTVPPRDDITRLFEELTDSWARLKSLVWHRERWSMQSIADELADNIYRQARQELIKKANEVRIREAKKVEKEPKTPTSPETSTTEPTRILPFRRRSIL